MKKVLTKIGIVIATIIVALVAVFFIYVADYYKADEVAIGLMGSAVQQDKTYVFGADSKTGFIFYPGGKVEAAAYAPLLKSLSEHDVTCVLVEMPFNLAVFDINAADEIIKQYSEIENWYIGGHSLGGAMASSYAESHPNLFQGSILLGAYPANNFDIPMIAIYGSEDEIVNKEKLSLVENRVEIEGGNHAHFGNYGEQSGDGIATITQQEQQNEAIKLMINFIKK